MFNSVVLIVCVFINDYVMVWLFVFVVVVFCLMFIEVVGFECLVFVMIGVGWLLRMLCALGFACLLIWVFCFECRLLLVGLRSFCVGWVRFNVFTCGLSLLVCFGLFVCFVWILNALVLIWLFCVLFIYDECCLLCFELWFDLIVLLTFRFF